MNTNPEVVALLLDREADINAKDTLGQTPLHWAAVNTDQELAILLLEWGAEVNTKNNSDQTPLHLSVQYGFNLEVTTVLLEWGANVNAKDDFGRTALHQADSEAATLLLDRGADVNAEDDLELTPLHLAAGNTDPETVAMLLDRGADVNAKDYYSQTPLHRAVDIPYVEHHVIQNDGSSTVQREALETPNLVMIEKTAELLLGRGGDAKAKDADGHTPCQLAREWEGFFFDTQFVNRMCSP